MGKLARWVAMTCAILLAFAGCGSASSPSAVKAKLLTPINAPTHNLVGTLLLNDSDSANGFSDSEPGGFGVAPTPAGGACEGIGGYSDISPGATVTVENQSGTIIATGTLGAGTVTQPSVSCRFSFVVANIPAASFYQVSVAHRGGVTYSAEQMAASTWFLSLTLGS